MFCHECGKKIDSEQKFCSYCGAKLQQPVQQAAPEYEAQTVEDTEPSADTGSGSADQTESAQPEGESHAAQPEWGHGETRLKIVHTKGVAGVKEPGVGMGGALLQGWHVLTQSGSVFSAAWAVASVPLLLVIVASAGLLLMTLFNGGNIIAMGAIIAILLWLVWQGLKPMFFGYLFKPTRDNGALYLPSQLTQQEAFDLIRRDFYHPEIDAVRQQGDALVFVGKKMSLQMCVTEQGIRFDAIDYQSKSDKKTYLYLALQNSVRSQVIAILHPTLLSPEEIVKEQKYVKQCFGNHRRNFWLRMLAYFALFAAFGWTLLSAFGGIESIQSCGISNSTLDILSTTSTVDETLDAFFANGKWSNDGGETTIVVSYKGTCYNTLYARDMQAIVQFSLNKSSREFSLKAINLDGEDLNWLEMLTFVAVIQGSNTVSDAIEDTQQALDEVTEQMTIQETAAPTTEPTAEPTATPTEEPVVQGTPQTNSTITGVATQGTVSTMNASGQVISPDDLYGCWVAGATGEFIIIEPSNGTVTIGSMMYTYTFTPQQDGSAMLMLSAEYSNGGYLLVTNKRQDSPDFPASNLDFYDYLSATGFTYRGEYCNGVG